MSHQPLVSVIIPAFNAENFIAATIDSILEQAYNNIEIIVIDDGSTDDTAQIVQKYGSRVTYIYQNNSGGAAVPRNTGIDISCGDFLCFFDADDLMVQDRIDSQVDFMSRHPNVGIVFCDYRNFNKNGYFPESHFQTCPILWSQLNNQKELILKNPCSIMAQENFGIAGTLLLRREILKYESGYDPALKSCEDFHFYFRIARHSPVGIINKVGMLRRIHTENVTGHLILMRSGGIRSRSMLLDSENDPTIKKFLNKYIVNCQIDLSRHHSDQGNFSQSLRYGWQAICSSFFSFEMAKSLKNILRTILMKAGLHSAVDSDNDPKFIL